MDTLFNPMGRIGPAAFRNAAIILIVIGACLGLLPVAAPALTFWTYLAMLLIYPWAVIWVKRFHDAGKSGKWFLAVFVAWLAVGSLASWFISTRFAPAMPAKPEPSQIWALMAARIQAVALPGAIASAVISLAFALVINEELKSDPSENGYGPPTAP
jgi:uncharacterized membrane protein YhaH (DUF805 family)